MVLLGLSSTLLHILTASLSLTSRLDFLRGAATCILASTSQIGNEAVGSSSVSFSSPLLSSSLSSSLASGSTSNDDNEILVKEAATRIRSQVSTILDQDPKLAGPLVRLAFHDATTVSTTAARRSGPNASIRFELDRPENRGLAVPLNVVLGIQTEVAAADGLVQSESGVLSLADIIALAGSEAVSHAGGPNIPIRLGRSDAKEADPERVADKRMMIRRGSFSQNEVLDKTLPSAGLNSDGLRQYFGAARLGLSEPEFVALSGSHGMGRHVSLLGMTKACLKNLTRTCLEEAPVLLPFVASSVDRFDNSYFIYLQKWNEQTIERGDAAFIPTDVALIVDAGLRRHVDKFAQDEAAYFETFVTAYQKLVERSATTKIRY